MLSRGRGEIDLLTSFSSYSVTPPSAYGLEIAMTLITVMSMSSRFACSTVVSHRYVTSIQC